MVDRFGRWLPSSFTLPQEKWCDMDFAYEYILNSAYEVQMDIEMYIIYLLDRFFEDDEFNPKINSDSMVNVEMLHEFVEASGGLQEFEI